MQATIGRMDLTLSPAELELQSRARSYVTDVLQPLEVEFEQAGGRLSAEQGRALRQAAIAANLHGGTLPRSLGGQGWTALEGVLVHEQFGQVTGGLWSYVPGAYNALVQCDAAPADALPRAVAPRRAIRLVRDHRGPGRVGRADPGRDRSPGSGDRRLRPQR